MVAHEGEVVPHGGDETLAPEVFALLLRTDGTALHSKTEGVQFGSGEFGGADPRRVVAGDGGGDVLAAHVALPRQRVEAAVGLFPLSVFCRFHND